MTAAVPWSRTRQRARGSTSTRLAGWAVHLPVAFLVVAYFAWFAHLSVAVQDGYGTPGFDMGIFDQGVWLLSRFHAPFVTVMGRDLFGDHTSFVLLLAVPLYWIHPAAQTLLVLQAGLIAAGGVPIYLVGRRLVRSTTLATVLTAVYLLNPALQNGNLEQFHPEAFLVFAIALALYAAVERRPVLLGIAVGLALSVKEDTALLVVPLGVWVGCRREWRWGVRIIVAAVASMAFDYLVVIRTLLGTMSLYANGTFIPFGGFTGFLHTAFAHPGRVASYLRSGGRPFYLWQMGTSTGWMWIFSPEMAAVGTLTFLENEISNLVYMHEIDYHYSLALVAVLVMGTVWAVSRLATPNRRAVATAVAGCSAVVCCTLWGLAPFSRHTYPHLAPNNPAVAEINAVRAALPPDAVVSAYYDFVPHVDHRVRCYEWPNPFEASYWGLLNEEGQRLPFAGQVQYLFLPTVIGTNSPQVLASIRPDFEIVKRNSEATLWRRRPR